jgi:glutamate-1-semialdehyde 2,1-aminomutase
MFDRSVLRDTVCSDSLEVDMSAVEVTQSSAVERYQAATSRSQALHQRAALALPGGNTRTTLFMQPYPFYFDHGDGCRVYDVDGNERLDFLNNYTSLILGHAHPQVVAAVQQQIVRGASAAAPSELEIALAEAIKQRLPSVDLLRFTNSGTEATMLALRAARAYTGREKIAKFVGSYHGSHDYASVDLATAHHPGIPEAVSESLVGLPFNDGAAAERIVEAHRHELAAVIVEPVMGASGVVAAQPGFLESLRAITQRHGIVLIFDEVISFRIGYNGAQGHFGVQPDLTTLGKIIGGGLPVGALGGRETIMACFDPRRPGHIGHGGTFNGNPITMAAGLATLEQLTPAAFERLEMLTIELKQKLCALFDKQGIPAQVNQIGSLFNIHFSHSAVTNYDTLCASDRERIAQLHVALLNHGVVLASRGMGCLSTPIGSAEIETFVDAIRLALLDLVVD